MSKRVPITMKATYLTVAALTLGTLVASHGLLYTIGHDVGTADREAVSQLKGNVHEPPELEIHRLRAEISSRDELIERLSGQADRYKLALAEAEDGELGLRRTISDMMPSDDLAFQIEEGEAKKLLNNLITVALRGIPERGTANITVNREHHTVAAGNLFT
jgi:hypothetical protein